MKHLTTLLTMAITFTGLAQQMPYNPDANGDDFVGVDDVLGVLGVYDTALMQPDLQCDYEGTDLEQFIGGLFEQSLVLDSVYIEYLIVDTVTTYLPGCPDPVDIETIIERSYTYQPNQISFSQNSSYVRIMGTMNPLWYLRQFYIWFYPDDGEYRFNVRDEEVGILTSFNEYAETDREGLPFPESWSLDEDGISLEFGLYDWIPNCESFRLIPFWHEAE